MIFATTQSQEELIHHLQDCLGKKCRMGSVETCYASDEHGYATAGLVGNVTFLLCEHAVRVAAGVTHA